MEPTTPTYIAVRKFDGKFLRMDGEFASEYPDAWLFESERSAIKQIRGSGLRTADFEIYDTESYSAGDLS